MSASTYAFVFPGQGSQAVGMLNGFAGNQAVSNALEQASAALHEDLGKLIAEGPAESLALTVNTQPAMLVASYGAYAAWRGAGGAEPLAMAGHSLGEYTALAAAGAIDLAPAAALVRVRARAMQDAVPVGVGGMAAIMGLDDETVRAVCVEAAGSEIVEPANFNAPLQVVIAGHTAAVARACELARARGAKRALALSVSAPFHSSLLKPAGVELQAALAKATLRSPRVPVVNNVDVAVETEPARIADALVRQASGPVRWVEVVRRLKSMGATHIIEFGPGKVLSGLIKRIEPDVKISTVYDEATLAAALQGAA